MQTTISPLRGLPHSRPCRQAGNAMLELLLILPLYVTLLFMVVALSEFGQVATQCFQVARAMAWEKHSTEEPARFNYATEARASFAHFGPRIEVQAGAGPLVVPLIEAGTKQPTTTLSTAGCLVAGAHAYEYPNLRDPLYQQGGTAVDSEYQDDADGANLVGICRVAMRGSLSVPGKRTVPWLRRHYGRVWVTYKAFGGLFGLQTRLRVLHTVLRASVYRTASHSPYTLTGHPGRLRDGVAYPYAKILRPDINNHQFELMGMDADFEPDAPMKN